MKNRICYLYLVFLIFFVSCVEKKEATPNKASEISKLHLPYTVVDLGDMAAFQEVSENWSIAGNVYSNRVKEKQISLQEGSGVLVNRPKEGKKQHLYTVFEHGDIALELDVMIPKGSNSGLYFQGRYELQLYDSWGVKDPNYKDMGGIYQRWDATKEKGEEGYEGSTPRINAAKAPGLWQHLKIIFHAPKFDGFGAKIKNAYFEEVWLNGILIQKDVDLTGVTRGGAKDEVPLAPLMLQGDHGPVAFKNIKYKLYDNTEIELSDLILKGYDSPSQILQNIDSLKVQYTRKTDSISPVTVVDRMGRTILEYSGSMAVPKDGDYLFEMKVNGGAVFLMNNDTVVSLNGDFNMDSLGQGKVALKKGNIPFKLLYNKHTPWRRGFEFYVEGPGIQRYSIQRPTALAVDPVNTANFAVDPTDEPVTQRSFWMHRGAKRTHCIAVGMPQGIHYTYDLETGSLLQLWGGNFMDATQMWRSRGEQQLGAPRNFVVSMHGEPDFAGLENKETLWPSAPKVNMGYKQLQYEFDSMGVPIFFSQTDGVSIANTLIPNKNKRGMQRTITIDGSTTIWHKIADGESIEKLSDSSFIINDESYFVDFSDNSSIEPVIRRSNEKDELLVEIPPGKHHIKYNIIW